MHKLLIAEGNDELRSALLDALSSEYILKVCSDGAQARALLSDFAPDILVLDLMLPVMDGISLLRETQALGIRPVTLVTLSYVSDYILGALQKYRVAYVMNKPCSVSSLACQIQELAATVSGEVHPSEDPGILLSSLLMELSLSPKVDGFSYLMAAIPLYISDPGQGLTKELYTAVGRSFGKNGLQVERCIRTAIQSAWSRGDMRVWQRYFPAAPDCSVPRPSNGDFISHIAATLTQQKLRRGA